MFEVGDMVVVYNQYIGWITYIDHRTDVVDVEFDAGVTDFSAMAVPLKYVKKVES